MSYLEFRFSPVDSWFFRDSRGFNAGESGYVSSLFPPSAQTLTGAIRHILGEKLGIDWKEYRNNGETKKAKIIGPDSKNTGLLDFYGPYLEFNKERLYPVPLFLLMGTEKDSGKKGFQLLRPGKKEEIFNIDLPEEVKKRFRLPEVKENILQKAKTIDKGWLKEADYLKVLSENLKDLNEESIVILSDLVVGEERVGIGRNNKEGAADRSLIYHIQHLRPVKEDSFEVVMEVFFTDSFEGLEKLEKELNGTQFSVPLGGEGRLARVKVEKKENSRGSLSGEKIDNARGIVLTLLTSAEFRTAGSDEKFTWTPDWNNYLDDNWKFVSACVDKPILRGGWDYKNNIPKPLVPLVPPGSSYFFEYDGPKEHFEEVLNKLKSERIKVGERTSFGYGEVSIGFWS